MPMLPTASDLRPYIGRTFEKEGERRTFIAEDDFGYLGDGLIWRDADGKEHGAPGMFIYQWISGAVEESSGK